MQAPGPIGAWQRAVLAVKNQHSLRAIGSCFVIDAQRGLLWSCSHVVGQQVGQTWQVGAAPPSGQPLVWLYEARVVHSTPPHDDHDGLDGALLRITGRVGGGALHPLTHADGQPLPALPLGDDAALSLPGDEPAILFGYPGVTQVMTPTVGIYSNRRADGEYLLSDSVMVRGHSGGPGLNQRGEVVGWNVRQSTELVDGQQPPPNTAGLQYGTLRVRFTDVHGHNVQHEQVRLRAPCGISELRPVNRLVAELQALQGQAATDAFDGPAPPDVRAALAAQPGCIAAGSHPFGADAFEVAVKAAEAAAQAAAQAADQSAQAADQSAQAADQSAQEAHHHEQGAYAHTLASASFRDDAARQAEAAVQSAGQASSAASNAQQAAIEANAAAATVNVAAATAAAQEGKIDETLKKLIAFVMNCSHRDQREQRIIIDRMVPVVGEAITTAATLARLGGSCILLLQVPDSVAQAAQDAASTRPEELAACGLLALRVAGENAGALCAAGSDYIERLMAFDFSSFNTPIATDEFVHTASAPPLAAGKMKRSR